MSAMAKLTVMIAGSSLLVAAAAAATAAATAAAAAAAAWHTCRQLQSPCTPCLSAEPSNATPRPLCVLITFAITVTSLRPYAYRTENTASSVSY